MHAQRQAAARQDDGFTLVELLVVIIVIGILAAVAIPVLLHQRTKGYNASAKSDLRQLAEFQDAYLIDNDSYGTIGTIGADGTPVTVTPKVTLSVVRFDGARSYCLSARHSGSPATWYWDPLAGGLQPSGSTGCPSATVGVAGDTVVG